jgi:hypothetical protein
MHSDRTSSTRSSAVTCCALAFASFGLVSGAVAAPVELGGMVGEPTGLSAKFWTSDNTAVTTAAAWSFDNDDDVHLHADVTTHDFGLFEVDKGELGLYYGLGGRILVDDNDDDRFGFRVPVGLAYLFESAPVTLFGEAAPLLDVAPATEFGMQGAIGVRFMLR